MTFTKSTSLICLAAMQTDVNNLQEALGRGPGNMSIELWGEEDDPELDPVVAYGCHTYDDELAGIIAGGVLPENLDLTTYNLTEQTAQAAINAVSIYSIPISEGGTPVQNFTAFATSKVPPLTRGQL